MPYYLRIGLVCLGLALLTAGLVLFGPRSAPVTLAAQSPLGQEVSVGSPIRVTFSRPVDRRQAEASFRVEPPLTGRFFWDQQSLSFQPAQLLSPETEYRIVFAPGLRDEQGRANSAELSWSFRTRGPRLLALRARSDGGSEIWLVGPNGAGARMLLASPAGISDLVMAPDGTQALYVEARGLERNALMLLNLESGSTRALVDDESASAAAPAWAAVGDFVTFERRTLANGQLGVPRIWLAQPDGTLLGPLYSGDGSDISYAPVWAPDGNRVAFLDGVSQAVKVYSFISDLTSELPARSGERVSWLPDGSGLVYSGVETANGKLSLRLRAITTAGDTPRDLTDGAAAELAPAVSPDGTRVAFVRRGPDDPTSRIWLVGLNGGNAQPLSAAGAHQDSQPIWSPDGRSVAFVRNSAAGPRSSVAVVVDVSSGAEQVALDDAVLLVWAP